MRTVEAAKAAGLNDEFRKKGFAVMTTIGVRTLADLPGLLEAVRKFDDFSEANDPYGEHDFGTIHWRGQKVFWKIDYYDEQLEGWCDPTSPACNRFLTVMLASEY